MCMRLKSSMRAVNKLSDLLGHMIAGVERQELLGVVYESKFMDHLILRLSAPKPNDSTAKNGKPPPEQDAVLNMSFVPSQVSRTDHSQCCTCCLQPSQTL